MDHDWGGELVLFDLNKFHVEITKSVDIPQPISLDLPIDKGVRGANYRHPRVGVYALEIAVKAFRKEPADLVK